MSIANRLAQEFVEKFDYLRKEKGDSLSIGDIDGLFKHLKSEHKDKLFEGIQEIAGKIQKVKIAVASPLPNKLSQDIIPDANLELDAVIAATEEATNNILDAVERIQKIANDVEETQREAIINEVTTIFEACNFQDISGQRINKVVATLIDIEKSVSELMEQLQGKVTIEEKSAQEEADPDADLMNGPQLDQNTPSQDDIDKLFAES